MNRLRSWPVNALCLLALVLAHPALRFFDFHIPEHTPDTVAYLTLARKLFDTGELFISGHGTAGAGLILPPFYPLLIALAGLVTENLLGAAHRVASASIVLATVPLYMLIRRETNTMIAVLALALLYANSYFIMFAFFPLTEALFILLVASLLWASSRSQNDTDGLGRAFGVGILAALVFFTRQIGLVAVIYSLALLLLGGHHRHRFKWRPLGKHLAFFCIGFGLLTAPYSAALFLQTQHGPLTQHFRLGQQSVAPQVPPEVLDEIEEITAQEEASYQDLLVKRRSLRKLLPDSSAMYSYVTTGKTMARGRIQTLLSRLLNPSQILGNVVANLMHLSQALGPFLLGLFLVSLVTPFFRLGTADQFRSIYVVAGFLVVYLSFLSVLTSQVPRYVYVIVPFAMVHIACEIFRWGSYPGLRRLSPHLQTVVAVALLIVGFLSLPKYTTALTLKPNTPESSLPGTQLRGKVEGAPVLTTTPMHAYLVGGTFRVLPNDSLEKVVRYARRTGAEWLVVAVRPQDWREAL